MILSPKPKDEGLIQWICRELRTMIMDGQLPLNSRILSSRYLSVLLNVSRGTVVTAYEELMTQGYLIGKKGSGYYVAPVLPDDFFRAQHQKEKTNYIQKPCQLPVADRTRIQQITFPTKGIDKTGLAFRANQPDLNLFPIDLWNRISSRQLRNSTSLRLGNQDVAGFFPLREAISDYLNTSRGISCTADQVLIVNGIQQALDLTARVALNPNDSVWMENPGYIGALNVFNNAKAKIKLIPVDSNGMDITNAIQNLQIPKLVYLTPAHQFPLGVTLSLDRRNSLLNWAQKKSVWIFEDDYDSEFRFSSHPLAALKSIDAGDNVVHAGTFNKMLFPSLRLGYMIVPKKTLEYFIQARSQMDRYSHITDQLTLAEFISSGHFGRHIRKMREIYQDRLHLLLNYSKSHRLSNYLKINNTSGGLQTIGILNPDISSKSVVQKCLQSGLEVTAIDDFHYKLNSLTNKKQKSLNGLILGFASINDDQIKKGIDKLALIFN